MKTIFKRTFAALLAAVLLLPLTGCGRTDDTPSPDSQDGTAENQTIDEYTETEPDYSWFEMPEETNKLTVYTAGAEFACVMDPAIRCFKEMYPDTEVSYQTYDEDEYKTMLRTEIAAGKGPDLVLFKSNTFPDIYKTMSTDIFADLNPYFALDEEINLSDFLRPVMDGGILNGKRYIVPICYEMPLLLTTQSILDEIGISKDDIATFDCFCEAASRFKEKHPAADLYIDLCGGVPPETVYIRTLYRNFGFDLIDYSTGTVTVDENRFRQCMDMIKLYYDPDYDVTDTSKEQSEGYYQGGALKNRLCLFDNFSTASFSMNRASSSYLAGYGESAVLFPQSNQNDGATAEMSLCVAIPNGSANKSAAWKLLKILLSDDIQGGHDENLYGHSYFWTGYPVRLASFQTFHGVDDDYWEESEALQSYVAILQSPTEALMIPNVYRQYISDEMMPYIKGERSWEECWQHFLNTLELYKDE